MIINLEGNQEDHIQDGAKIKQNIIRDKCNSSNKSGGNKRN